MSNSTTYPAVVDRQGKLPEFTSMNIRALLLALAGKHIQITIEEWEDNGSANQQRYYFKCIVTPIHRAFREAGNAYSVEGVHHWLMQHVGGWVEVVEGAPVLRSYMKLKVKEREQHHEMCRAWAAETLGLQLKLPNENDT